jgi:hypothetical protein
MRYDVKKVKHKTHILLQKVPMCVSQHMYQCQDCGHLWGRRGGVATGDTSWNSGGPGHALLPEQPSINRRAAV